MLENTRSTSAGLSRRSRRRELTAGVSTDVSRQRPETARCLLRSSPEYRARVWASPRTDRVFISGTFTSAFLRSVPVNESKKMQNSIIRSREHQPVRFVKYELPEWINNYLTSSWRWCLLLRWVEASSVRMRRDHFTRLNKTSGCKVVNELYNKIFSIKAKEKIMRLLLNILTFYVKKMCKKIRILVS